MLEDKKGERKVKEEVSYPEDDGSYLNKENPYSFYQLNYEKDNLSKKKRNTCQNSKAVTCDFRTIFHTWSNPREFEFNKIGEFFLVIFLTMQR